MESEEGYRSLRFLQDSKERLVCMHKRIIKQFLERNYVPVPGLIHFIDFEIEPAFLMEMPERLVIKPDVGGHGKDILILERISEHFWREPDGQEHSIETLAPFINHITNHLSWLRGKRNGIIIEERVEPHPSMLDLSPFKTPCDFRLYYAGDELLYAKMRMPTKASKGYGNTARGAFSVIVNPEGIIHRTSHWEDDTLHPENGKDYDGMQVPQWESIIEVASQVPVLFKSPLVCVDGMLNQEGVFVVLEITLWPDLIRLKDWEYLISQLKEIKKKPPKLNAYQFGYKDLKGDINS